MRLFTLSSYFLTKESYDWWITRRKWKEAFPTKPFCSQKGHAAKLGFCCEKRVPLQKISRLRNHSKTHVCHFTAQKPISQLQNELRNHLQNPPFAAKSPLGCEITSKLRNELRNPLRNSPFAAKSPLGCEITFELQNDCEMASKLRNGLQATKLTCKMGEVCKNTLQS